MSVTLDELKPSVGHQVTLRLTPARSSKRARSVRGRLALIGDYHCAVIDSAERERRVSYSEVVEVIDMTARREL